jgi:glycosyltransferase involved in cell wall biosynthesis
LSEKPSAVVLYDGWSLVYQPNSPAALNLLAFIQTPIQGVKIHLAVPGDSFHPLPVHVELHTHQSLDTSRQRFLWEQFRLPRLARSLQAQILHLMSPTPALFNNLPVLINPVDFQVSTGVPGKRAAFFERLRLSFAAGAMDRVTGVLYTSDLPGQIGQAPRIEIQPFLHPAFQEAPENGHIPTAGILDGDFPDHYVLYHGPTTENDLTRLLDAWMWVEKGLNSEFHLLVVGLDRRSCASFQAIKARYPLSATLVPVENQPLPILAALYRGCSALFHPVPITPWGDPLRWALALGKPVVALETAVADALAGPAAYLVPTQASTQALERALGAALITVLMEESIADSLEQAARERSAGWKSGLPEQLGVIYQALLSL